MLEKFFKLRLNEHENKDQLWLQQKRSSAHTLQNETKISKEMFSHHFIS